MKPDVYELQQQDIENIAEHGVSYNLQDTPIPENNNHIPQQGSFYFNYTMMLRNPRPNYSLNEIQKKLESIGY